ncbi:MAG: DUF5946 family protein [Anaerolineae bacterium]|nr:DUF5946 family protein [Anaerolineae bacterium]
MKCSCGQPSADDCKMMFDELLAKVYTDFRYGRFHRLVVDTYSLQHPHIYMISGKSFAAHLTGLCCAVEYGGDTDVLRRLQQWLSGNKTVDKPDLPAHLGDLTIAHVVNAPDGGDIEVLVQAWAESAWQAYRPYHQLARDWVETVI